MEPLDDELKSALRRVEPPAGFAERVLAPDIVERIQFQPWFTNVLMHEMAHGLGPGFITVNGQRTTVNQALRLRRPLTEAYPRCPAAQALRSLGANLAQQLHDRIPGSVQSA